MDLGREKHRRSGMDGCEGGTVSDSLAVSSLASVLEVEAVVEESDDDLRRRDRTKREGIVQLCDLWLCG